jgi:hypothetical protein
MPWHIAHYQRFFSAGKGSHCFRVLLASAESPRGIEVTRPAGGPASSETQSITDKVIQQLRDIEGQSVRIKGLTEEWYWRLQIWRAVYMVPVVPDSDLLMYRR